MMGAIEKIPEEAYTILDRLDEKMIGSELAGLVEYGSQELIYSFKIDGREVTGLSWPGAKSLARWMAERGHPLDAVEKEVTQDEEEWYADVKIIDKVTGLGLWGTSKAKKMKEIHIVDENRSWVKNTDGTWKTVEKPDEFARTIALNKAQRNAILSHVPDKMIAQFIKQAIEEGKVRKVPPEEVEGYGSSPSPPSLPPHPYTPPPSPYTVDRDSVLNAVETAGLDTSVLAVYPERGILVVQPLKFFEDKQLWTKYSNTLALLGAKWISMGKESRWEIKP